MTVQEFIAKWSQTELKERSAAQEHFLDICAVFAHPTPAAADPAGDSFCFERGAAKHGGGDGFADVWKRGFFGWEYKGRHKNLDIAYDQLLRYRDALENPPLLVLCDFDRILVRTNFTGTVSALHEIPLAALGEPRNIEIMRAVFHNPETLRPGRTSLAVTQDAASRFAEMAAALRGRGLDPAAVAHFLDRIVFCQFAEDTGLLPDKIFSRVLEKSGGDPVRFGRFLAQLFDAMAGGGDFGLESIRHFNGSLFDDPSVIELTADDVRRMSDSAALDWSAVDPSIFGTLFERGLDPAKRSQLGAHFTGRADIELVVDAVVMADLRREWDQTRTVIESLLTTGRKKATGKPPARPPSAAVLKKARGEAAGLLHGFLVRLQNVAVLDPACGSGNFLYVALLRLKDLEKEVILYGGAQGLGSFLPMVGPWQLHGIEINPYAHDLAQMTVWIGWLQWIRANGFGFPADPILRPLGDNIRLMDAIMKECGTGECGTQQSGSGECGTGVPPVVVPPHGQDAHATSRRGTGVPPVVESSHGQDAHATQDAHASPIGLDPCLPVDIRQGSYLPHWTQEGATYAVNFRLFDSLPAETLRQWLAERDDILKTAARTGRDLSDEERQRLLELHSAKIEKWLDAGHGSCWLKDERIARLVRDALAHFDGSRYDLFAWCVMPNHVHAVVRPAAGHALSEIMHSWKSFTVKKANALLDRTGEFWQAEYFDHLVRDEDDFRKQVNYVLTNPARAGLTNWPWIGCRPNKDPSDTQQSGSPQSGTGSSGTGVPPVFSTEHGQDAQATARRGTGVPPVVELSHGQDAQATSPPVAVPPHGQDAHATPTEPDWPAVDYIVGNPPFLGGSKLWKELGRDYQERLWQLYKGRVPGGADLCCYWFEKARAQIAAGKCKRAGLLATQGIRGGANREVLKRIKETGDIFWAESDRPWILDGANVHVSMVGFDNGEETSRILDGKPAATINVTLTSSADIAAAHPLPANRRHCFQGSQKIGPFEASFQQALDWLLTPNPHGKPNSDVLKPSFNGMDLARRPRDCWMIDFGTDISVDEAALYHAPFTYVLENVRPTREQNNREAYRKYWWRHGEPRIAMRTAIRPLHRFAATPEVAKHRIFAWLDDVMLPDKQLLVVAKADDLFFGILHSRFHEVWALAQGTQLREKESGFRYTPTTCFETFPFPPGVLDVGSDTSECGTGVPPVFNTEHGQDAHATSPPVAESPHGQDAHAASRRGTGVPPVVVPSHGQDAHATQEAHPAQAVHAAIAAAAKELNALRENWLNPPEWTRTETLEFPGTVGGPWDRYIDPATVEDRGAFKVGTVRYPRLVPRDADSAAKLKKRTLTNLYNERPAWLAACHEKLDAAVAAAYGFPTDLPDDQILEKLLEINLAASKE